MIIPALALLTLTAAAPDFEAQMEAAGRVRSLKKAVTALVGDCDLYAIGGFECQQKLKGAEKRLRAGPHYLYFGPMEPTLLKLHKMKRGKARFLWTPVVDVGRGLALTVGRPSKLGGAGPVVKIKVLDVTPAPGVLEGDLMRAARLGQIALEAVGEFGRSWKLSRGGRTAQGVTFRLRGVRLLHARTGKPLGEIVY